MELHHSALCHSILRLMSWLRKPKTDSCSYEGGGMQYTSYFCPQDRRGRTKPKCFDEKELCIHVLERSICCIKLRHKFGRLTGFLCNSIEKLYTLKSDVLKKNTKPALSNSYLLFLMFQNNFNTPCSFAFTTKLVLFQPNVTQLMESSRCSEIDSIFQD